MPPILLLLPLFAQLSPSVGGGAAPSLDLPTIDRAPNAPNPRHRAYIAPESIPAPPGRFTQCLTAADSDPEGAIDTATAWLKEAHGSAQAEPQWCLGTAYSNQGEWAQAEKAFLAGRDIAAASDHTMRIRLADMAGNAALADGTPQRALTVLDAALAEARSSGETRMTGEVEVDRARALVALKRDDEAAAALADARSANPNDASAWLLSATLSRRMNKLADAQAQIETAAGLAPTDPEVGLEAGVIAILAGHEAAARKSWQSVVTAAPESEAGRQARAYLEETAPAATSAPAAGTASTGTH